ncbi:MAG: hypothetical protein GY719_28305 [bacterium]|nr:hypothetical protein [bacterium]
MSKNRKTARSLSGALLVGLLLPGSPLIAQPSGPDPVAELRAEIAEIRREYEDRLSRLEARLAELEGTSTLPAEAPGPDASAGDELDALRAAARAAAGEAPATTPPTGAPDAEPRQRSLNLLNPEISFTGNVLASATDAGREDFEIQEIEIDLQAALDPFSRTRLTLAIEGEEIDVEEGYVEYSSLPGGLELTLGKFRQQFGVLNRQHLHALPQVTYPAALTTYFGEEALAQTGVSLRWLLPKPWASANEITLQVTDGGAEVFGGEDFEQLSVLAHVKSFWETGQASWFEWGLSGIAGGDGAGGDSRIWGTDLTYHWQPPERAKYREITWRTEVLLSQRDDLFGRQVDAWGGYAYLEGLLRRNLYLGLRYDDVADPFEPDFRRRGIVPYLTWWQSEFVRLRAEYQRLEDELTDEEEDRFLLQLTWAAGPHKHETY